MVGSRNSAKTVSATENLKIGKGTLVAVYVTKANAADSIQLVDASSGTTPEIILVLSDSGALMPIINKPFGTALRAVVTGTTARYVVVWN